MTIQPTYLFTKAMVCFTLFEQTERVLADLCVFIVDTSHTLIASEFNSNSLFQEHISTTPLPKLRIM